MLVATLSRRTKDGARKRLRTTSLLQSKCTTVSLLRCRFYSQKRATVNDVVIAPSFFFSSQFCCFFTHISERSIVNTLNDARSNLLFDETMSSHPFHMGIHHPTHFQFSSPQLVTAIYLPFTKRCKPMTS